MGTRVAAPRNAVRSRRSWLVFAVVSVLLAGGIFAWPRLRPDASPNRVAATTSLAARTIEAGEVTVKIQPRQLDAGGAVFTIIFDTHSVELNQDLRSQARLVVGGTTWPTASWTGDGPSGHHREGDLRFTAAGSASGTATLTIDGLPDPVTTTWTVRP